MAKYKDGNFLQLRREIFSDDTLSINAKWLYVVLNELEHKFTGKTEDFFFRRDEDLAKDTGMSLKTLKRAKKELLNDSAYVKSWQMHWIDKETGKKSKKHCTAYRVL